MTQKPVKFGTVTPELVAFAVQDSHYKDLPSRIMAISDAFNEELHDLADAGCPVIQMEEPQIHLLAARGVVDDVINPEFMLKVFNNTVKGCAQDGSLVPHLLGQSVATAHVREGAVLQAGAGVLNNVDADVITFETKSSGAMDLEAIGKQITTRRLASAYRSPHAAGGVA